MKNSIKFSIVIGIIILLVISALAIVANLISHASKDEDSDKSKEVLENKTQTDSEDSESESSPVLAVFTIISLIGLGIVVTMVVIRRKSPNYLDVLSREKAEDFIKEQLIKDGYELESGAGSPGYYIHYFEEGGEKYHPRAIIGWSLKQRRRDEAGTKLDINFIVTYDISLRYPKLRMKFLGEGISRVEAEQYIRNIKRGITGQSAEPIQQKVNGPTIERANAILKKIQEEEDEKAGVSNARP